MGNQIDVSTMPTDVSGSLPWFDRFAASASAMVSRAWFFVFCVAMVVLWAPSILLLRSIDTWQLIINTVTTIVTFLMVALLQNAQTRADLALQHKLNALADGLADLMEHVAGSAANEDLRHDMIELRAAVGLEDKESSSDKSPK